MTWLATALALIAAFGGVAAGRALRLNRELGPLSARWLAQHRDL